MEFRRRFEGIFTKPIPTDNSSVATRTVSFVEVDSNMKRRVETFTGFNKHPVRNRPMAATNRIRGREEPDFITVPLVAFSLSRGRWGGGRGIPQARRQLGRRC